ncbi:hypothetical protein [Amycolatopsis sp. MtRt-6]|uniref:hypothetical protein n=1 Tax=Amycolatopsis sp. MtRt-6 TaxID=2792782 RepID=UPI001A8E7E07|nr:hypothetical protein [Amycolatopsis sp. MtRt-6]
MTSISSVLHAEWTKFRTVRGWAAGLMAAALMVVVALLAGPAAISTAHRRSRSGRATSRSPTASTSCTSR